MKLLLTGSSGFIGSYFQNHYGDKYDIETFSFLKDDLEDLDLTQIDVIVHLSALVHQMERSGERGISESQCGQHTGIGTKSEAECCEAVYLYELCQSLWGRE